MRCPALLLAALAAAASPWLANAQSAGPEPKGEIGGTVVSAQTGELLKGALVSLRARLKEQRDESPLASGVTGPDGQFVFTRLPAGDYEVWISKSGYDARSRGMLPVTLQENQLVRNLATKLWRLGVISGRTLDPAGEPLPGVRVVAYRWTYVNGQPVARPAASVVSDDLGEYRLFDLPAGKYTLGAFLADSDAPPGVLQLQYADTFYPNAFQPGEAAPVRLAWGADLRQTDIRLLPIPDTLLAGAVADAAAGGACAKCLVRYAPAGSAVRVDRTLITRPDGGFLIRGLAPGTYRFSATALAIPPRSGAQEIQVGPGAPVRVGLLVARGQAVSGSVALHDQPAAPPPPSGQPARKITVFLAPDSGAAAGRLDASVSAEGGSFTLQDVPPGTYQIRTSALPAGGYLKLVSLADQELPEPKIALAESSLAGLKLRIAFDGGAISGAVKPPAGSGVVWMIPVGDPGRLADPEAPL